MMIRVTRLAKSFNKQAPLWSDMSFEVPAGSVTVLTGPSGSGKSTLLNCIGALEKPDEGSIDVFGTEVTTLNARRALLFRRTTVGYLFQDYALTPDKSVYDNIALAAAPTKIFTPKNMLSSIDAALEEVGLAGYGRRQVFELSGGEQQRVAIARLLVKSPKVVLADEPTGALDNDNSELVVATHSDMVTAAADQHIRVVQSVGTPLNP